MRDIRKYEFPSKEVADELLAGVSKGRKDLGNIPLVSAIVNEEGEEIAPAVVSGKWHVDVAYKNALPPIAAEPYATWPDGNGQHIFADWEEVYAESRLKHLS